MYMYMYIYIYIYVCVYLFIYLFIYLGKGGQVTLWSHPTWLETFPSSMKFPNPPVVGDFPASPHLINQRVYPITVNPYYNLMIY